MDALTTEAQNSPLSSLVTPMIRNQIRVWDNWYLPIQPHDRPRLAQALSHIPEAVELLQQRERCFIVGYLNAPRVYYDGELGPNNHHLHSRVGTAMTSDFKSFVQINIEALVARENESSIWSGSFAQGNGQYYFFYTYRPPESLFGLSQEIGVAITNDFITFQRLSHAIVPDPRWYATETVVGHTAIHCFRDPFPFHVEGNDYLLISAKSKSLRLCGGEIGINGGDNGVIAVYQLLHKDGHVEVVATPLCFACMKPEMEVASIYFDCKSNEYVLFFSAHPDSDYLARRADERGLPQGTIAEVGVLYEARIANLPQLLKAMPEEPVILNAAPVAGTSPGSYANRIVTELGGITLGFDLASGLPVCGHLPRPELQPITVAI